jgi:hypothetical protein
MYLLRIELFLERYLNPAKLESLGGNFRGFLEIFCMVPQDYKIVVPANLERRIHNIIFKL